MSASDLSAVFTAFQDGATRLALNWLLQSALLIALGLLGGRILRRRGAAVQSVIYRSTLAAVLLCPAASLLLLSAGLDGLTLTLPAPASASHDVTGPSEVTGTDDVRRHEALPSLGAPDAAARVSESTGALPADAVPVPPVSPRRPEPQSHAGPDSDPATLSTPRANVAAVLACVLTVAWPIVSGLMLLRLLVAYGLMARVRRQAYPADPETLSCCRGLAVRIGAPAPSLLRSPLVTSPCLFGLLRPAILLPDEEESPASSEILVHELAHLARHDCLWNLLSRVSLAVLFFQPLLWVLSRRMVRASEEVCDDYVLGLGFDSRDYARRLADVAERYRLPGCAAAVAVVSLRSWLGRRVVRILDSSRRLSIRVGPRFIATIDVVAVASTILVGLLGIGGTRAEEPPARIAVNAGSTDGNDPTGKKQPPKGGDERSEEEQPTKGGVLLCALGTVVDADGKPVAAAKVYLREWSSLRVTDNPFDENPRDVLATVQTAADGKFRFEKVPAPPFAGDWPDEAPWDVVVVAEEHGMAWRHLRSAEDRTSMTLKLPAEAKLTGRLVDGRGQPVAGAEVKVAALYGLGTRILLDTRSPDFLDLGWSRLAPRVQSDAEGRFAIGGLPPETLMRVIAEHDQYALKWAFAATTDQPQPDVAEMSYSRGELRQTSKVHTGGFTIELEPAFQIRGRVLFADTKKPCPAAKMSLSWESAAYYAIADAQGRFAFHGLFQPEWYISASPPKESDYLGRRVHVAMPGDKHEAEVQIELPRGQLVTGSVVDETTRKGVPGVRVYFQDQLPDDAPDRVFASSATTDEDGAFRSVAPSDRGLLVISGPVEGYDVPRGHLLRRGENPNPRFVRWLDIKPAEAVPEVRFTVSRGVVINGRVTDPEDKPLAGAEVKTLPFLPYEVFKKAGAQTDADGRFTLAGLPNVKAQWLEIKHRQRRLIGLLRVETEGHGRTGQPVNIDVQVQPAAKVTGRVLVGGQPSAGIRVSLSPDLPESGPVPRARASIYNVATDDSGRFEFGLIPPGKSLLVHGLDPQFPDLRSSTFSVEPGRTHELPTFDLQAGKLLQPLDRLP